MKIAHVCPFYTPAIGGVKQVVEELAKNQIKNGNEVHVYTSDWDKEKRVKIKDEIIEGVHIHRCKHILRVANFATIWPSIFLKILKEDFDIIHSHVFGHMHFFFAALAAKLKKIPHVHTTHCPWTDAYRSIPGRIGVFLSYNLFSRFASKLISKFIAITPWEIDFIKKFGGSDNQIVVIPNGMDKSFFKKIKNNDFKTRHGIKGRLVLFFGRLNITKGPEQFVEIAKIIIKKRKDIVFVIRGPDEGMREIVKKAIGDEKRILLLEEIRDRSEILKMYQAADVFVLPSYREGLPLTLFEAMSSGLPIVASPVNGIPFEMKDPENGFLVQYGNNEEFAKKILKFLDDKKLADKISKSNIKKAQSYRWDDINKRTLELYKDLKNL
jgi:glycosyltransferase involved in cell wall biosynthesis